MLKGMDFSDSEIDGIGVMCEDIKGLAVNEYQAMGLAKLLGIIIK